MELSTFEKLRIAEEKLEELIITKNPCGHLGRYVYSSDEGTSCCLMCALDDMIEQNKQLKKKYGQS